MPDRARGSSDLTLATIRRPCQGEHGIQTTWKNGGLRNWNESFDLLGHEHFQHPISVCSYGRSGGGQQFVHSAPIIVEFDRRPNQCRIDSYHVLRSEQQTRLVRRGERLSPHSADNDRKAAQKVARMDDFVIDELFSISDGELLLEAQKEGVDVGAVGAAGRLAFERAKQTVGRKRLALIRQQIAEDKKRAPIPFDRGKALSEVRAIIARNREAQSKLTIAARNESGDRGDDMDSIIDDFAELGAIAVLRPARIALTAAASGAVITV